MRARYGFSDDAVMLVYYFLNIKLYEKKIFFSAIKKIIVEKYFDKIKGRESKWHIFLNANDTWKTLIFDAEAAFNEAQDILNKKSTAEKKIITENKVFSLQVLHEKERFPLSEFFLLHCFVLKNGKEENYYEMFLKDEEALISLITLATYRAGFMVMEQFKNKLIEKLKDVVMTEKLLNHAERKWILRAVQTEKFRSLQGLDNNEMQMLTDVIEKARK
jgi:hypothetical protein